jgi:VanZ family protein
MILGSSCREDKPWLFLFNLLISTTTPPDDDTMLKANITIFRASLCLSLTAITFLAVIPPDYAVNAGINDKISHIAAFYVLTLLADFSFPETNLNRSKIISLLLYGLSIECVQYFIPYREFSLFDLAADAAGLLSYRLSLPALKLIPLLRFRWDFDKNM